MQDIEPYYNWRHLYVAEEDEKSPFYGREYSEFEYTNQIYNYLLHPQWDDFGSPTLFIKIVFVDYDQSFAIIEMIGEWNDCINNDIMLFKRDIAEKLIAHGINKFILIGENVLNFHASDDCYYEEWFDEIEEGFIVLVNFREHVLKEFEHYNLDYYLFFDEELTDLFWRSLTPFQLFQLIEQKVNKRLSV